MWWQSQTEEEGSVRERFLESLTRKKYHAAPSLDGSCSFIDLPISVIGTILSFLPFSSLSTLSKTCSIMNKMVRQFLKNSCSSGSLFDCKARLVAGNAGLLTPFDQQLAASMHSQLAEEVGITWQDLFSLIDNMEYFNNRMDRVSLLDQRVDFPHRDNPIYVEIVLDEQLSRHVVWVKNLRQFFPLQISYTWEGVHPGVFRVAIRIKVGATCRPHPESYMTKFTLRWPRKGNAEERVCVVGREWWDMVSQIYQTEVQVGKTAGAVAGQVAGLLVGRAVGGLGARLAGQVAGSMAGRVVGKRAGQAAGRVKGKFLKQDGLRVEWEEVSGDLTGWIRVEMDDVVVERNGDISFMMKDVRSLGWGPDLMFDYLELKKLNKS